MFTFDKTEGVSTEYIYTELHLIMTMQLTHSSQGKIMKSLRHSTDHSEAWI